jgi:NAD(P)-dependent dehydrogenase (short-subunit alcohol dehydrogenase family)
MVLLENKIALVTGGSSGIGRAAALAFAREGARVVVSDVNVVGGHETVEQIVAEGSEAIFVEANVASAANVEVLIHATMQAYGRLDCAFNNAGVGGTLASTVDKTEDEWETVMGVNLKGVWLCMKYQIPVMVAQGSGAIVNMASVAGLNGFPNGGIYAASKHGVIGLTRSAALEYARQGIRVNAVCPGYTDTPMVRAMMDAVPQMERVTTSASPMRRLADPAEIAAAVVWLCSDKASFVTGHALPVDGGFVAG